MVDGRDDASNQTCGAQLQIQYRDSVGAGLSANCCSVAASGVERGGVEGMESEEIVAPPGPEAPVRPL